ncbi:hypothetical protein AtNW77_Chr5g0141401 [Arabidopsis thaliana]|uniref:Uncharacterized protein n=4 Tax=Arabidopsis TaxID=3701 RepID=A0A654GBV5_ARATH|nr:uncharacterized protein AT5G55870 [Arabidopsis thaliana]KAG7606231.1 hypothetical protein ISN45_At05g051650 [Arabidopsis thaliana x Arabidopsis arenosa]KAG7613144.1 hypothetical protein ISN44_As05g050930 [Arabidopsis suecica]AED96693.1 hypothetical protein AT5G55870 [Arabidopsis thaliana]CAA0410083.1 unnamed protein product [Arabidopsis thaliana]VYS70484.1 unnamed protein product [Arabidopsis thaliana]|eukprot:NP_200398.1 hypothetical protein AT5G55870 [Arabidopsis thaliana]
MSLLLNQPLKLLCFRRKPVLVRSSLMQTPPCSIVGVQPCGADHLGRLDVMMMSRRTCLEKKVPLELVNSDPMVTIGSSHGWVATLKEDGILRLQDDLNPVASDTNPKRIPLPPLVTLPHCQTQIVLLQIKSTHCVFWHLTYKQINTFLTNTNQHAQNHLFMDSKTLSNHIKIKIHQFQSKYGLSVIYIINSINLLNQKKKFHEIDFDMDFYILKNLFFCNLYFN